MTAVKVAGNADARLAVVADGERIDRFGFVLAVFDGLDDLEALAGEVQREPAIVTRGTKLGILIAIVEIIGCAGQPSPGQGRLDECGAETKR